MMCRHHLMKRLRSQGILDTRKTIACSAGTPRVLRISIACWPANAVHLCNTDPPYNVKVEPRSNNAIAAGLSSFSNDAASGNSSKGKGTLLPLASIMRPGNRSTLQRIRSFGPKIAPSRMTL